MLLYRMRAITAFAFACVMMLGLAPAALAQQASTLQVQLASVTRTPTGTILVKWTYHNTGAQPQTIAQPPCVLEANGTKYPASVSSVTKGAVVSANQTLSAWAVVAGPGADVTKVTVHISGADPIKDVPVTSS
jgi:hypothetical protein